MVFFIICSNALNAQMRLQNSSSLKNVYRWSIMEKTVSMYPRYNVSIFFESERNMYILYID